MESGAKLLGRPTKRFTSEYELTSLLGRGSFGEVWVCREHATGHAYACKLIDKASLRTHAEREDVQREIAILEAFAGKHEGVVRARDVMEGESSIQIVMELCQGGDLFELLKERGSLPEAAAKGLFRQLASSLAFCHSHGVVHRDIKPENILLTTDGYELYDVHTAADHMPGVKTRLADFGLAAILQPGEVASGYTGSKYYTAPEMVKGCTYGKEVDVWSMGIVLCTMLTGRLPFAGQTKADLEGLRRSVLRGKINFNQSVWDGVSESAKDLVRGMLKVDPNERCTAEEVVAHPWLAESWHMADSLSAGADLSLTSASQQVSQSLPSSPVDTHRVSERPCASAQPAVSEFSLKPAAPTTPPAPQGQTRVASETETASEQPKMVPGTALSVAAEQSVADLGMLCCGALPIPEASAGTLWSLTGLLAHVWGSKVEQPRIEAPKASSPKAQFSPGMAVLSSPACRSSRAAKNCLPRIGEHHQVLAPVQEFYAC